MDKRPYFFYHDEPALYRIQLLGRLGQEWSSTFDEMRLEVGKTSRGQAVTTIRGAVTDQAALHGLLNQIRDLGMVLLLVERLED
jgi:hypothetical protein